MLLKNNCYFKRRFLAFDKYNFLVIDSLVPGFLDKIDYLVFVQTAHDDTVHLGTATFIYTG